MINMEIELKPRYRRWRTPRHKGAWGFTPVHDEAQWDDEQIGTAEYVDKVVRFLRRGGTLSGSMLGQGDISSALYPETVLIREERRLQRKEAKEKKKRHLRQRRIRYQDRKKGRKLREERAARIAMEARFPAWEKSMLASRGIWLTGFLTDDGKSLLLYHPDPDDSMMGLYIRVQGYYADAGMYRGGAPYLEGVQFEMFWGRPFPSTGKAQTFVLKRAMGESQ